MKTLLTIGQLSKRIATTAATIRYYEKEGLIPPAPRSQGGYRLYSESLVPRFNFIKNAKAVGFSLTEIKKLLSLQQNKQASSQNVKNLTLMKVDEITQKINALKQIQNTLAQWASTCNGKVPVHQCPIVENLYKK